MCTSLSGQTTGSQSLAAPEIHNRESAVDMRYCMLCLSTGKVKILVKGAICMTFLFKRP